MFRYCVVVMVFAIFLSFPMYANEPQQSSKPSEEELTLLYLSGRSLLISALQDFLSERQQYQIASQELELQRQILDDDQRLLIEQQQQLQKDRNMVEAERQSLTKESADLIASRKQLELERQLSDTQIRRAFWRGLGYGAGFTAVVGAAILVIRSI